jgi:hypothetical protein
MAGIITCKENLLGRQASRNNDSHKSKNNENAYISLVCQRIAIMMNGYKI